MKKVLFSILVCTLFAPCLNASEAPVKESGLLVAVHGSPSPKWNEPMGRLETEIREIIKDDSSPFLAAKIVNLEFQKPFIADGVKELVGNGCKRIVCMPLFIAHSSHVVYDVPAALGMFSSQSIHETLMEEGAEIAPPLVPIVMGPTLSDGDLLLNSALQRVKELSKNPEDEAVVIFSHGDEKIEGIWDDLSHRTACYICAKTGITYANWEFVEVGQSYSSKGLGAVFEAGRYKKRILVIGLYVSMGPKRMHERFAKDRNDPFEREDFEVVFSDRGFLPDPAVAKWLIETAAEVDANRFGSTSCQDKS